MAESLRAEGLTWVDIARELQDRFGLNPRAALRLARGWSQSDAAKHWNARFPHDLKTFKSFSYWELWPSPSGHAPPIDVLDKLAALYECSIGHLLEDWPSYERNDEHYGRALPDHARAGPLGRGGDTDDGDGEVVPAQEPALVNGIWHSRYGYRSTSRRQALAGEHYVAFRQGGTGVRGESLAQRSGSKLSLDLAVDGQIATGTWREHTSPHGHYGGATYHGAIQLVVDPRGRRMKGRWLGYDAEFRIAVGDWRLEWVDASTSEEARWRYAFRL